MSMHICLCLCVYICIHIVFIKGVALKHLYRSCNILQEILNLSMCVCIYVIIYIHMCTNLSDMYPHLLPRERGRYRVA